MEWSWRTVMILLGLLAMVAILIDGFRRMRRARAEALRLDVSHDFKFPEEGYNPELGEVRVVAGQQPGDTLQSDQPLDHPADHMLAPEPGSQRTEPSLEPDLPAFSALDDEPALSAASQAMPAAHEAGVSPAAEQPEARATAEQKANESPHTSKPLHTNESQPNSPLIPKAKPVNLDEQVPVLLDVEEFGEDTDVVSDTLDDSADAATDRDSHRDTGDADCRTEVSDIEVNGVEESGADAHQAGLNETDTNKADEANVNAGSDHESEAVEAVEPYLAELEDPETVVDPHLELEAEPDAVAEALADTAQIITQPVNFAGPDAELLSQRPEPEVVLVIHALAQSGEGFKGSDLIYLFNSCDLRYGEKNIFHRFEEADGAGCIQFSVSQSHEPGVFEPSQMAEQTFRGLSFFMSLPGAKRPLEAYEAMSEMAMVVARNLKADVLDESQSALTPQTIEANREEIMAFERHQHLMMKKQGTR